ncbi:hypothetical protein K4B79_02900 [Streptomyces lincolnensis]|uniref:hypothetical protein n=1 Tax=Streptomyces lincolnensis TaxID=1915 RepID=UPI001E2BC7D7|nr:hypothetical protein [Streptomyces lincolnensis]MCD7437167.1 hypothetical protein [Streptomyces lincolnensis]
MSTRTTFEDRLLDELQKEIERREPKASVRPLLTARRIAVVVAACAAAWLATVTVPGSPAESTAFATEPLGNGSVRLTVKDQFISVGDQHRLADEVGAWGIEVTIAVLDPGYVCERSKVTPLVGLDRHGNRMPVIPMQKSWDFTLRPGNVLAFENMRGSDRPRAVELYATRAEVEPCVPVKLVLPGD